MSKILLLGDINSAHLKKWAFVLHEGGHKIGIFSLSDAKDKWYEAFDVSLVSSNGYAESKFHASQSSKLSYLKKRRALKTAIKEFKPDFLHAHYASSYGLLGAISEFHPYFISVWGSDVLLFPKNLINKKIIRYNFKKADRIIVSSQILKKESQKYTSKDISIIPFGVDTDLFKPLKSQTNDKIVIGTVKSLERIYGIDILLDAFAIIKKALPNKNIELHLIGIGSQEENLSNQAKTLGVLDSVKFLGNLIQTDLPSAYSKFAIAVFLSRSESFGVSILEASACKIPVVVSATGGLLEVVDNKITGFHTELENSEKAAAKILQLINDEKLRNRMGKAGREKVIREYALKDTVAGISKLYKLEDNS